MGAQTIQAEGAASVSCRHAHRVVLLWLGLGLPLCLISGGCNDDDHNRPAPKSEVPPDPDPEPNPDPVAMEIAPGEVMVLEAPGLAGSLDTLSVAFTSALRSSAAPLRGVPLEIGEDGVSVLVPTGAPSGSVRLSRLSEGTFVEVTTRPVAVAPQIMGYLLPSPPRVPGVVEGDHLLVKPQAVILYGRAMDSDVEEATIEVLSVGREWSFHAENVAIDPHDTGLAVAGVSDWDPTLRGVRVPFPDGIGRFFLPEMITYLRLRLYAGERASNAVELAAIPWGWDQPRSMPYPAFITGVAVGAGVQGNLLELLYTVFQPAVSLKWRPVLESLCEDGETWEAVEAIIEPGQDEPLDSRTELILAGDARQQPSQPCMAGPGATYRLLVDVREAWPETAGQVRLRLSMVSEPISHGEIQTVGSTRIEGPLKGNRVELPFVSIFTAYDPSEPLYQGKIVEDFSTTERFDQEASTGHWARNGAAMGLTGGRSVTGSGTAPLDENVLAVGHDYLFDTDTGTLFAFPGGTGVDVIEAVRSDLTIRPTSLGLEEVWAGRNPGAEWGELHVSRLVVPGGVTIYGRGTKPLIIRVAGTEGTIAARIDGAIILDGLPGGDGEADSIDDDREARAGTGGMPGPGGMPGGMGGVVGVGFLGHEVTVLEALPAEPAPRGGGAGQTMTYVLPEIQNNANSRNCFVYGGAGAGGGFGMPGRMGRAGARTDGNNAYQTGGNVWASYGEIHRINGRPGPVHGSADLLPVTGGTGGGGGGGFLARRAVSDGTHLFGVGGGGGGGGGGAFQLVVRGSMRIGGTISARGSAGGVGRGKPLAASGSGRVRGTWGGSCGGGGSGGAILLQVTNDLTVDLGALLDVSGGRGGSPGMIAGSRDEEEYLASPNYPLGGDGGAGRIALAVGGSVSAAGVLIVLPSHITPQIDNIFTGTEVVSWVWSTPLPFSLGPGHGVVMGEGRVLSDQVVYSLIEAEPISDALRLRVLLDGTMGPGSVRFQLVFTGDAETGEVLAVDRIELPWEPVFPDPEPPAE